MLAMKEISFFTLYFTQTMNVEKLFSILLHSKSLKTLQIKITDKDFPI